MEVNKVRDTTKMLGRLNTGIAYVPPVPTPPPHLMKTREELPIANMREEIINLINGSQVLIVSGETGSGKTTQVKFYSTAMSWDQYCDILSCFQVPQFILEHCHSTGKSCRIICAQPRRISAVSVSERVAAERGEELGFVVGYQIRLESK
jgi:HrpA-like RNA helicase